MNSHKNKKKRHTPSPVIKVFEVHVRAIRKRTFLTRNSFFSSVHDDAFFFLTNISSQLFSLHWLDSPHQDALTSNTFTFSFPLFHSSITFGALRFCFYWNHFVSFSIRVCFFWHPLPTDSETHFHFYVLCLHLWFVPLMPEGDSMKVSL